MLNFFSWYLLVTLLGWLTFPLAWRLFPALTDRGYSLARAFGLLVWGYLLWMMASLGIAENDGPGLALAAVSLAVVSGLGFLQKERRQEWGRWVKTNVRFIVVVEVLFFLTFACLAFGRASTPEIVGTEKPMELAFINAILRSPTFPPHDPWLSGYAISYYYFGYVITAMLAKATSTLGSVAFNLMLALVFALGAVGAYGLLYNLLALWRSREAKAGNRKAFLGLPLLGPLFLLIVSNFEGFFEILYRRGAFWTYTNGAATSSFWKWLDLQNLRDAPMAITPGWMPERYYWWWRASRVLTEYNLSGAWNEIIDEFPFFSFLLGDLHPHVLAIPFGLLAVAVALNLFLGGWKGETNLGLYRLPVWLPGLFTGALVLGGMAFLNTWDILPGFGLLAGAYVLGRALTSGWSWRRLEDLFAFGVPLGGLAILLYLPFYVGFSSQAGGIIPNLEFSTRGVQLWIMFGPLLLPIFAYLTYLWRGEKRPVNLKAGLWLTLGLVALLWIFSILLGLLAQIKMPELISTYLADQGFLNATLYVGAATMRRLERIGSLLTLLAMLIPVVAMLAKTEAASKADEETPPASTSTFPLHPASFALFLILLGALLVLAPEFVYLRDQFADRMNTIFKFYYQAWMLLSLAAAFGAAVLLTKLRGIWEWVYRIGLALVLVMALIYPVLGILDRTNSFHIPAFRAALEAARGDLDPTPLRTAASVWTLDGGAFFDQIYPDDMVAAAWLRSAPYGVIVEATIRDASYSDFAHISIYSGLPTVLGWPMHEGQWRGTYEPQGTRQEDIQLLYETRSWEEAQPILSKYDIRYVYLGTLENQVYRVYEDKFAANLSLVYEAGGVKIYEVP